MKKIKIIISIVLCMALMAIALTGCGGGLGGSAQSSAPSTPAENISGMKPGAIVKQYKDSAGNDVTQFNNQDGTGGGFAEID